MSRRGPRLLNAPAGKQHKCPFARKLTRARKPIPLFPPVTTIRFPERSGKSFVVQALFCGMTVLRERYPSIAAMIVAR